MVDAFAQYPHYYDHIKPIWDALSEQGTFYVSPIARRPGVVTRALGPGDPLLVAGFGDLRRTRHREHVFVEHGAGETWGGIDPHYAGGPGRSSVRLFLNPNQRTHDANRERYPQAKHVLTGSARVEWLLQNVPRKPRNDRLRVVVSFHWDNRTFDATRSALVHFAPHFGSWAADSRIELMGHAHPRIFDKAEKYFARAGVPMLREFTDVVSWADVYACDNSSTIFEAAACGIPVVLLDAPWFPKGDGSWRFDKYSDIGPHTTENLVDASIQAFDNPGVYDEMVTEIFGAVDGAAVRAAKAIEVLYASESQPPGPPSSSDDPQPSLFGIN